MEINCGIWFQHGQIDHPHGTFRSPGLMYTYRGGGHSQTSARPWQVSAVHIYIQSCQYLCSLIRINLYISFIFVFWMVFLHSYLGCPPAVLCGCHGRVGCSPLFGCGVQRRCSAPCVLLLCRGVWPGELSSPDQAGGEGKGGSPLLTPQEPSHHTGLQHLYPPQTGLLPEPARGHQ